MSMIGFPLLLIPLAIYNIVVFLMQGVGFDAALARVALPSGRIWVATFSDGLLALGLLLLILEMIKASRPGAKYFTDHLLSFLVLAGAAAEFVMLPQFATSTFFLLTVLALVDFLASVGIRTRRERPATARGRKQSRLEEPAFQPSTASGLAAPTDTPKPAPVIERQPHLAPERQPDPVIDPQTTTPPTIAVEPPDAEPKREPAAINPQR